MTSEEYERVRWAVSVFPSAIGRLAVAEHRADEVFAGLLAAGYSVADSVDTLVESGKIVASEVAVEENLDGESLHYRDDFVVPEAS